MIVDCLGGVCRLLVNNRNLGVDPHQSARFIFMRIEKVASPATACLEASGLRSFTDLGHYLSSESAQFLMRSPRCNHVLCRGTIIENESSHLLSTGPPSHGGHTLWAGDSFRVSRACFLFSNMCSCILNCVSIGVYQVRAG